jgi:DNA-binding CsgD family transcriptional regulator
MARRPKVTQRKKLRRGPGNRPPNAADVAARIARKQRRNKVFGLVISGASYRQVASQIGISLKQVHTDMQRAISEIGTTSNAQKQALYTTRLEAVLLETNAAIRALRDLAQSSPPDINASRALALHTRTLNHTIAKMADINIAKVDRVLHEHGGVGGGPIVLSLDDILTAVTTAGENEAAVRAEMNGAGGSGLH